MIEFITKTGILGIIWTIIIIIFFYTTYKYIKRNKYEILKWGIPLIVFFAIVHLIGNRIINIDGSFEVGFLYSNYWWLIAPGIFTIIYLLKDKELLELKISNLKNGEKQGE